MKATIFISRLKFREKKYGFLIGVHMFEIRVGIDD